MIDVLQEYGLYLWVVFSTYMYVCWPLSDGCFRHTILSCCHLWKRMWNVLNAAGLSQSKTTWLIIHIGDKFTNARNSAAKLKRHTRILLSECYGRQFTLNEDTLPEYSANMYPPKEHQIREDEHGSGESREKGNATPFHRRRKILLLGNQ